MSSATGAMAHQQRQETRTTTRKTSFWDDLYKGARAVGAVAGAADHIAGAADKGVKLYDDIKVKGAYDDIAKAFQDGGFDALQNNPDLLGDYHHSLALGKFFQDRSNSEKGRLEMIKKMDEAAERQYQDFRLGAMGVQQAWDKKDINGFNNGMVQLMGSFPSPYKYEVDSNGNFNEMFRSDKDMGWTATGRTFTGQQMLDNMQGILRGEQMILRGVDMKPTPHNEAFNRAARANYWNTVIGNQNKRADPKAYTPLYDRNGNVTGMALIQNPWQGEDGKSGYGLNAQIEVFDTGNGKLKGRFNSFDEVARLGLSHMAPKKAVAKGGGKSGGTAKGNGGSGLGLGPKADPGFHRFMVDNGCTWNATQKAYKGPDGNLVSSDEIKLLRLKQSGGSLLPAKP